MEVCHREPPTQSWQWRPEQPEQLQTDIYSTHCRKLCECVICSQLKEYLSSHSIICPQQYGFRAGLSTEAAMLDAVIYAAGNMDLGTVASLVTADTSKTFDSIEQSHLLEKLGWYGIDEQWFGAWLWGRTQS